MTPRIDELEVLSSAIKKCLRRVKGVPGIPDAPASDILVQQAKNAGLVSEAHHPTLQGLLAATEAALQAAILTEFKRVFDENMLVGDVRRGRRAIRKDSR